MKDVIASQSMSHSILALLSTTSPSLAVDPMILARGTPGFSGAELQNMVKCVVYRVQLDKTTHQNVQFGCYPGRKGRFQGSHSETL